MRVNEVMTKGHEINNPQICARCESLLPSMLPPGATLRIVLPDLSKEGMSNFYVVVRRPLSRRGI